MTKNEQDLLLWGCCLGLSVTGAAVSFLMLKVPALVIFSVFWMFVSIFNILVLSNEEDKGKDDWLF